LASLFIGRRKCFAAMNDFALPKTRLRRYTPSSLVEPNRGATR
jgi:hypothetical protein